MIKVQKSKLIKIIRYDDDRQTDETAFHSGYIELLRFSVRSLKGKFTQKLFFDICFDIGLTSLK